MSWKERFQRLLVLQFLYLSNLLVYISLCIYYIERLLVEIDKKKTIIKAAVKWS